MPNETPKNLNNNRPCGGFLMCYFPICYNEVKQYMTHPEGFMMIEKMMNNLKDKIEQAEQDIAADILKVFGYPNNIERQILGGHYHVRYVNMTNMSLLAEMQAEIVNTELVINIFKNDILTTQVTS